MREVLVAGASGVVGSQVLSLLLAQAEVTRVVALVRRPLPITHPRLVQHVVDFSQLDNLHATCHADTAFCCLGTTIDQAGSQAAFRAVDHDAVLAFARLAQRMGVSHFLAVSAVGASATSANFYSRVKGEVEQRLRDLGFPRLTLLQPSLLTGPRDEFRLGERIAQVVMPLFSPLMLGGLARYRPIPSGTVAAAMVAAARDDASGQVVLHWPELTSLAATFSLIH